MAQLNPSPSQIQCRATYDRPADRGTHQSATPPEYIAPEDGLPTVVCSSCRDQLESCHRFRRVAHRTQKSLQSYLSYTSELGGSEQHHDGDDDDAMLV
uniref:ZAD domain-containing protein n=1 Tax=Anopheles dirus TaxID=7168 RepID=A0A182NUR6_9DIPT